MPREIKLRRHLIRLVKSIENLGLRNGLVIYYYYVYHRLLKSKKWDCQQVSIRTASKPFWLRPGVSDWIALERIFFDREYDPVSKDHDEFLDRCESDLIASGKLPLIIDCGANVGLSSVWFANRFPRSVVVAVEPEMSNYKVLSLTAKNYPNIIPVHAAVSNRASRVSMRNQGDTPWSWQTLEEDAGDTQAITIPHIMAMESAFAPMVVKVDIEGFETSLFRSGTEWVDDLPLLVFEMHDWMSPGSGSGHSFFSVLSKLKRDYLIKGENIFSYRGIKPSSPGSAQQDMSSKTCMNPSGQLLAASLQTRP